MAEIDKLKLKKEELMQIGDGTNLINNKLMKVCEICGALQAINDTERRMQTHLEGKLHTGFAILRKEHASLKNRKDKVQKQIDELEKEELDKKGKKRSKSPRKKSRSRGKSRSRSKNRDKSSSVKKKSRKDSRSPSERKKKSKRDSKHHSSRG